MVEQAAHIRWVRGSSPFAAIFFDSIFKIIELLAKITFLQEAPKMEIANLLWYRE